MKALFSRKEFEYVQQKYNRMYFELYKKYYKEKTKVKNDYFKVTSYGLITGPDEVQVNQDDMEEIGMFLIQGHRFLYNEAYKDKDVYFVTSIENLISFEDIKSKISGNIASFFFSLKDNTEIQSKRLVTRLSVVVKS